MRGLCVLIVLIGWLIPLLVAATYIYVQMPSATSLGLAEVYREFGNDRLWLALWGIGWALSSALVTAICVSIAVLQSQERGLLSRLKLVLWPFGIVEVGALCVSAPMSYALSHADYDGPIPHAWVGSGGVVVGIIALLAALVLSLRDLVRQD